LSRVSHLCLGQPGLWSSYLCIPCSWDNRCTPPYPPCYWLRWGLKSIFVQCWPGTVILPISVSQVAKIIGVSHCTWVMIALFLDNKLFLLAFGLVLNF
jgi:hypothetical protein